MTMADWAELSRELAEYVPWAPILVTFFLVVSGFIFLNLIVALICEAIGSIDEITAEIDAIDEIVAVDGRSIAISNFDRMQYIENSQKYILDMINSCTITANNEGTNPGIPTVDNTMTPSPKKKRKLLHTT